MRLPADTTIAEGKLTRYLLLPQARGDKSTFLARAGYTRGNADQLLRDLRTQILPLEAVALASNKFGRYYEIRGTLTGPNGVTLAVCTIWMTEHLSGVTKFVTRIPDKRVAHVDAGVRGRRMGGRKSRGKARANHVRSRASDDPLLGVHPAH